MRRGFSLIELVTVVTLLGLMTLVALPRLAGLSDRMAVRHQTAEVVAALDMARATARRLSAPARLVLADSALVVECTLDSLPVVEWRSPGPVTEGVGLTGSGAPITFSPAGLAMGAANRTVTLARGSASHRVVISRLGRITR